MRCAIQVDLSSFPAITYSQVLAGREQGYENCEVSCTQFVLGDSPRISIEDELDRLVFLFSGALILRSGQRFAGVTSKSLIRLPAGSLYSLEACDANALCVEITSSSGARRTSGQREELEDLKHHITEFRGFGPIESGSGFDYTFLANRQSGSPNVAVNIARVAPGRRGPDFHIHKFDQFYFLLSGELVVEVGFDRFIAKPLSLIRLPAGIVHRQGNEGSEPEVHLSILSPEPPTGAPLEHQIKMPRD